MKNIKLDMNPTRTITNRLPEAITKPLEDKEVRITITGPLGSGKSILANQIAQALAPLMQQTDIIIRDEDMVPEAHINYQGDYGKEALISMSAKQRIKKIKIYTESTNKRGVIRGMPEHFTDAS